MRRLLLSSALLALAAGVAPATAALPTTITAAQVFKPAPSPRTVAVVRPESGTPEADAALAEGLRRAGLTVVAPGASPQLLVSYVVAVRRVWGFFPNANHAGSQIVPDSAVNDNYTRTATVVAWDAGSPRPSGASVAWIATLRSGGLSQQAKQFLPDMLLAGAPAYGRTIDAPRRPLRG